MEVVDIDYYISGYARSKAGYVRTGVHAQDRDGCCSRRIWISLLAFITRYLGKGLYIKTCIIKK